MKKVLKWIGITLGVIIVLVLSVPVLLYVPMVQDFAVKRTLAVLNDNGDDLRYGIGQLRLRFPLEVELWDVCLLRPSTADTLAYVHHLHTALDDFPWQEQTNFVVHQLLVEEVRTALDTTLVPGLELKGSLDTLSIREVVLNLDSCAVSVDGILLHKPHFDVAYTSADTAATEEPDTTQSAPWKVTLGALDIRDTHVKYDVWLVDSLDLHLSHFDMKGVNLSVDTLTVDLPESHIGVSSQMDLSYLADSTTGWGRAHLDMLLSRKDVLKMAGRGIPELSEYWPDSTDVTARLSAYLTPDELEVSPLYLQVPGLVDLQGEVKSLHPFDNGQRLADARLQVILTHTNTLMYLLADAQGHVDYRMPDSLTLTVEGNERRELCQAELHLEQDSTELLSVKGEYNLRSEAYWTELVVSGFNLSDFMPSVLLQKVNLRLNATGQHFEFDRPHTMLQADLHLDTLSYQLLDDSTDLQFGVHDVVVLADLHNDSIQVHGDINCHVPELGDIDSLRIDFRNSRNSMGLGVQGGDAQVEVQAACDVYQLMDVADRVMHELDMQSTNRIFDINALQRVIPSLSVQAQMRQENPLMPMLKHYGVTFDALNLSLTNTDSLRMAANIDSLQYDDIRVAHIGAKLVPMQENYDYLADVLYEDTITGMDFGLNVKARLLSDTISAEGALLADTMEVLSFDAALTNRIHADIHLATLPLAMVNGFLPDEVKLAGSLNGHALLDCDSIDFNALTAAVWFDSASVWYEGCDLTLKLPQDSIVYRDGQLLLDHIRFGTSNDHPIDINGKVDLREDMANPAIDLVIMADNARIIRNKRRKTRGQFLYGTLPLSTAISVLGKADDLKVTGTIAVPEGCDLTYFYEDNSIASSSQLNDLVEFVRFDEDVDEDEDVENNKITKEPSNATASSQLDVNLKISINPSTKVLVYVPTGSGDKVMIQGGGDLKMSMDGNGNLQLSGGYDVMGGDIDFTLPMLPVSKQFALTNEGWLRWSGIVDQPELNLKATEKVKCTINDANSGARVVRFEVSILIRGTLENMDIIFDCSAPDDATIQSELASLTEEDRSKQALMLLIAQTYTGPSASTGSAGIASANAALSSLVNKELESLLTGKLQHTEINVDIDSYDADGTGSQKTDYSVSVTQKFFDDRMRVTVGGKMSTGDEVQQDDASIINDVSVEWLIKKDASQYARLFRKTNYESVLEGEVVETGVGYVQKREAYRFWHLFIRSNQKRREALEKRLKELQEEEFLKNR